MALLKLLLSCIVGNAGSRYLTETIRAKSQDIASSPSCCDCDHSFQKFISWSRYIQQWRTQTNQRDERKRLSNRFSYQIKTTSSDLDSERWRAYSIIACKTLPGTHAHTHTHTHTGRVEQNLSQQCPVAAVMRWFWGGGGGGGGHFNKTTESWWRDLVIQSLFSGLQMIF